MKKCILLSVLLFISTFSFAQKCKYFLEKKDPFTGKLTLGMSCELLKTWRIGLAKTDTIYSMDLQVTFPGVMEESINKGDTLMIALENDKPLILFAVDKSSFASDVVGIGNGRSIISIYNPFYAVTKEDIIRLSANNIIAVKVYLGPSAYSIDIPEKNAKKITKAASCLL
ncbi:hypothetical protein F0919_09370 [Taibaiella lutea]|uniref:Uncharacterized protein n=1 Tax=Taibaiella lutea TaxID=2608001 RepID=A0A5M6CIB4_9BACT|nr:hypothetical protein [Taibaiella lutea]KAA5534807.1 hypothetical protein F0919_09370 [Taibaiella lutea]